MPKFISLLTKTRISGVEKEEVTQVHTYRSHVREKPSISFKIVEEGDIL